MRRTKPESQLKIAKERINILFEQARLEYKNDPKLSNRYVYLARKIGMKFNVKIPPELRRQFCHKCYNYLLPGKNAKVRTNPKTKSVEYRCLDCGHVNRYGYSREK